MEKEKNDNLCNIDKYSGYNIGKRIKATAYAQNITIKELCSRAGVSANVVQQMQAYSKMPRVDTLANIADVLNISIDTLLDRAVTANTAPIDTAAALQHLSAVTGYSTDYIAGLLRIPPKQQFKQ